MTLIWWTTSEHAAATPPEPRVGDLWWVPGKPETVRWVYDIQGIWIHWNGMLIEQSCCEMPPEWQSWVASGAVLLWREGGTCQT